MVECPMTLDDMFAEGCRLQVPPSLQKMKASEDTDRPTVGRIDAAIATAVRASPRTFTQQGSARSDDWATWFVRYIWEPYLS